MTKNEPIAAEKPTGLALLRAPFPANQISKLPKPTAAQTREVRDDFKRGIRCDVCGGWHHPKVVHLDYVGHAALTDRLLDCDLMWNWEPVATDEHGRPVFDTNGGMWIRLTVCGVTRLGYGHPDGKSGGDAIKETVGDALRNAAMRFGAALDLWHKGDLHGHDDHEQDADKPTGEAKIDPSRTVSPDQYVKLRDLAEAAGVDADTVCAKVGAPSLQQFPANKFAAVAKGLKAKIDAQKADPLDGDQIPDFEGEK